MSRIQSAVSIQSEGAAGSLRVFLDFEGFVQAEHDELFFTVLDVVLDVDDIS